MRVMQLAREGSPPPGLRLPQAELSHKSNQIARRRLRRFESYMPSQAVWSLSDVSGFPNCALHVVGKDVKAPVELDRRRRRPFPRFEAEFGVELAVEVEPALACCALAGAVPRWIGGARPPDNGRA